jgi:hypothetical protein
MQNPMPAQNLSQRLLSDRGGRVAQFAPRLDLTFEPFIISVLWSDESVL